MPHGHSDTAIDFYASAYCREMLDIAHPTRIAVNPAFSNVLPRIFDRIAQLLIP